MKKSSCLIQSLVRWLFVFVFVAGGLFFPQAVQAAAGPCSADYFHAGIVTASETWCTGGDNIHWLTNDVIVPVGVTLTIAAGVTVDSIPAAWSKYLTIQGHLDITGTSTNPVLLTRSVNYPDQNWSGLYFDGSQGDGSGVLSYATIEHAGSNFLPTGCTGTCGNGRTAVFVKDLAAGKQVTISNSTFRNNVSKGLYVVNSKVNVTNTTFSQNQYPILINGTSSVVTYSGNIFSNNGYPYYDNGGNYTVQEDAIFLDPDALMGQNFSLPVQTGLEAYVFTAGTGIPVGRTMTVQPGVTLRTEGAGNFISVKGQLKAIGTSTLPIRFTGIPGSDPTVTHTWGGLIFDGPSGASGRLEHVIVEYGCEWWNSNCASLMIYKLAANKSVVVEHSIMQNSTYVDMAVIDSPTARVDNNLIKGGKIGADLATNLTVSNLAVVDQELDGIIVETGYSVEARHLTIARAGQVGFYVRTGGTGLLKNSILSHNTYAVWAEGSSQTSLDTNLADANTTFSGGTGTITELRTINGSAAFTADGFHIQNTSAAVSKGRVGLGIVDMDGDARPAPAGSPPDLGADEVPVGHWSIYLPTLRK